MSKCKNMKTKILLPVLSFILFVNIINAQNSLKLKAYTPQKGTTERKEILDALREKMYEMHHLEVIFVVKYMKVFNGWAWVHTLPQSPDGKNKYEDVLALIHKENNGWQVKEIPCTEIENPECIDSEDYFTNLKKRFPDMPVCILP